MQNKGQIEAVATLIIFGIILIGVAYIVPMFFDFSDIGENSDNISGEFEIDEESVENIGENVEEFTETVTDRFDFSALLFWAFIMLGVTIVLALIVIFAKA